jgi:hypothetical protein
MRLTASFIPLLGLWCALACELPQEHAPAPVPPISFDELVPPVAPVVAIEVPIEPPDPGDPKLDVDLAFARGIVPFQPSRRSLRARERRLEVLLARCAGSRGERRRAGHDRRPDRPRRDHARLGAALARGRALSRGRDRARAVPGVHP